VVVPRLAKGEAALVLPALVVTQDGGFRWGLLRSVNDLRNGPCRSATTGPHERFWSVQKVESGQYNRLI